MQWNAQHEGGGYCGIQDLPKGKAFIYSLWDPKISHIPIKAHFKGLWTEVANFGGEGTGLRSLNISIGWKPDQWYSLVSRVWSVTDHSYFGFWVHDLTDRQWTHVVTMDYPVKHVTFTTSTGSFVEDFGGTGSHKRTARYRQGFKRKVGGSWFPFSTAHFSVIQEAPTHNYRNNYDAGTRDDYYYLSAGDSTHPTQGIGTSHTFHAPTPSHPTEAPIDFTITSAKPNLVTWHVPESSTPQFKYTVHVNGHRVASDVRPEVKSYTIHGGHVGQSVEVTLEDILGNIVSRTVRIAQ